MERACLAAVALIGLLAGCGEGDDPASATATLADGATVTLTVRPMVSLQSDWHRMLTIADSEGRLTIDLPADTGWWRGSQLYRHRSGAYVLHEGQPGCIAFALAPPRTRPMAGISCAKAEPSGSPRAAEAYPASRYYPDLFYLGRFVETRMDPPVRFMGHDEGDEAELPAIL